MGMLNSRKWPIVHLAEYTMKKPTNSEFLNSLIEAGGELALAWLEQGYMAHRGRTFKDLSPSDRAQIPALRDLHKRRYVNIQFRDDGAIVKLTQRGAMTKLMETLGGITTELPMGNFCYVVFDIPERHRGFRRNLTQLLKHAGFERLQKSVWRTRRDVVRGMQLLLKMNPGVEKYIRIIVGRE